MLDQAGNAAIESGKGFFKRLNDESKNHDSKNKKNLLLEIAAVMFENRLYARLQSLFVFIGLILFVLFGIEWHGSDLSSLAYVFYAVLLAGLSWAGMSAIADYVRKKRDKKLHRF